MVPCCSCLYGEDEIGRVPMHSNPLRIDHYLSDKELISLFNWISDHEITRKWEDKCFLVRFILGSGMRIGELCGLTLYHTCRPDGVIDIHNGKGSKTRRIRVSPELYPYYRQRFARLARSFKLAISAPGVGIDDAMSIVGDLKIPLFPCRTHLRRTPWTTEPVSKRTLQQWYAQVIRAAGISRPINSQKYKSTEAPHIGRHTYATWELSMKRLSLQEVSWQLGHSSIEITSSVYGHLTSECLYGQRPEWPEAALGRFGELIWDKEDEAEGEAGLKGGDMAGSSPFKVHMVG